MIDVNVHFFPFLLYRTKLIAVCLFSTSLTALLPLFFSFAAFRVRVRVFAALLPLFLPPWGGRMDRHKKRVQGGYVLTSSVIY